MFLKRQKLEIMLSIKNSLVYKMFFCHSRTLTAVADDR